MTQLIYHPAFDPYNALLRACRILTVVPNGLDSTSLRILEFYLLFPEEIKNIRLSGKLRGLVRKLNAEPRFPYDRLPAPRALFDRMAPASDAALQTLIVRGLVYSDDVSAKISLCADELPTALSRLIATQNESESELMSVVSSLAVEFSAAGSNGLKDRTGLAEFRYDVA